MNWLWSQVFQGSVKNVFAVSVPSLTLAGTVNTQFIICLEVEVLCVLVWDHAHWLGQKQNTQNLHLQTDDKRCKSTQPRCVTPRFIPKKSTFCSG